MPSHCRHWVVLVGSFACAVSLAAQPAPITLAGAWKIIAVRLVSPDSTHRWDTQAGLAVFTRRHYSMMWVEGDGPRVKIAGESETDAEKVQAYDSFRAMTGTFDLNGRKLLLHPGIAKDRRVPGQTLARDVQLRGDTATLVSSIRGDERGRIEMILVRQGNGGGGSRP